jgi:nuclear pore complex protein Nup155
MAIEGESPLALAADELMKLENAEGLADVCLICASNFGGAKVQRDDSKELGEAPVTGMFDWEKGLYHQPPHEQPTDTTNSQPSSSQSIVSGVQATKDDALKVCHSIMFHHISKLLGSGGAVNERLAEEIVRTCASSSDVKFLHAFYEQLVATNNVDTLLRIDSVTLENWLKEKNDVNLLYNYYSSHQRYVLAGGSMWNLAVDDTQMIPIGRRIEYLTRAANAYSATSGNALASEQVSSSEIESTIRQIEEQLDVAKIQDDVLNTVQRSENTNLSSEKMDALGYKLLPVSDLYNEYAAQLNLYDICLMIIETCKQQNHDEISKCWKLIIFEEILPCRTRSPIAFDYLNELRDGIVQDEIIFGETKDESVNEFDDGSWVPRLVVRVTELGKKLYGKDANFTFPVPLLLEVLEG